MFDISEASVDAISCLAPGGLSVVTEVVPSFRAICSKRPPKQMGEMEVGFTETGALHPISLG